MKNCGNTSAVYGLGLIGVAVYYLQTANTFWEVITSIVYAIFWPGLLTYNLFRYLGL